MLEIRSLAVHPSYYRNGLGTAMIHKCIVEAKKMNMDKVFVLTYAIPLFAKLGFKTIDKGALPLKIWSDCHGCQKRDYCDETAMILDLHLSEIPSLQENLLSMALSFE